jgi:hypothetical protein
LRYRKVQVCNIFSETCAKTRTVFGFSLCIFPRNL